MTVAGVGDGPPQHGRRDAGACRRERENWRRRDERAKRAVESPLSREHGPALIREIVVNTAPAMFKRGQRRLSREFGASDREAQPVAGHRVDEPGGVTGEQ